MPSTSKPALSQGQWCPLLTGVEFMLVRPTGVDDWLVVDVGKVTVGACRLVDNTSDVSCCW